MSNVVVTGCQWGDEGKGKVVDWLASRVDVVVRFQGGHNAGHTLVIGDVCYKLSLLPSGVVRNVLSVIGSGVVINPWSLLAEIDRIGAQGVVITPQVLMIADNAALTLPSHGVLDKAREAAVGKGRIGTTGRGIGPAYEDKVGRRAIRVCDLADPKALDMKLDRLLAHHNALLKGLGAEPLEATAVRRELDAVAPKILPYSRPVWRVLAECCQQGKCILFEGAQGTLLDVDHGTYPFVTSSNTLGVQAALGSGVSVRNLGYALGIVKAYCTRVGEGPFPTEQDNAIGQTLGERGTEFGTVTGRRRRCGWFDAVLARQAVQLGGIDGMVLTKLDVLDGFEQLNICVGYTLDGRRLDYFPASMSAQAKVQPVYETLDGWSDSTRGIRSLSDLPAAAVAYVRRLEQLMGTEIAIVSTSPEREDVILLRDPFDD